MYSVNRSLVQDQLEDKQIRKIEEDLRSRKMPDDVVAGILSFLTVEKIPLDTKRIHTAMHEVKQEHPDMLESFRFSRGDLYPFSRLLEKTLFRLQNSSLISTTNPDFKNCIVSRESKEFIRRNILPLFSRNEQQQLQEMGRSFERLMTSP